MGDFTVDTFIIKDNILKANQDQKHSTPISIITQLNSLILIQNSQFINNFLSAEPGALAISSTALTVSSLVGTL